MNQTRPADNREEEIKKPLTAVDFRFRDSDNDRERKREGKKSLHEAFIINRVLLTL
jgi:hypothetical protein